MSDVTDRINKWNLTSTYCYSVFLALSEFDLEKMIKDGESAISVGPFVDPTLWKEKQQALKEDLVVLKAAYEFVKTVKKAMER